MLAVSRLVGVSGRAAAWTRHAGSAASVAGSSWLGGSAGFSSQADSKKGKRRRRKKADGAGTAQVSEATEAWQSSKVKAHPVVAADKERLHYQLPRRYANDFYDILPTEDEGSEEDIIYLSADEQEEDHFKLPSDIEDEYRTSDSDGAPRPPIGDDPTKIPLAILDHFTSPLTKNAPGIERAIEEVAKDLEKLNMHKSNQDAEADSHESQLRFEMLKDLKREIEDPLPMPNRPLWPLYSCVLNVDSMNRMTARGQEAITRVLLVVGNMHGAAGFGFGKHSEPAMATRYALRNARRNMVYVPSHNGQLYHDLVGKKNGCEVIIRATPERLGQKGSPLVRTVMEYMGITSYSAKIVGSKTKNKYTIVQALFDAFQNVTHPSEVARKRGKRMVWATKDRRFPREDFPYFPRGPRFQPHRYGKV